MKILVLNCGSSTLKFQLIETTTAPKSTADDVKLARGIVDRIGGASTLRFEAVGSTEKQESAAVRDHAGGVGGHRVVRLASTTSGLRCRRTPSRSRRRPVHQLRLHRCAGDRCPRLALRDRAAAQPGKRQRHPCRPIGSRRLDAHGCGIRYFLPSYSARTCVHISNPSRAVYEAPIRRYGFHGLAHQYSVLRYGELTGTAKERVNLVTIT